VRAPLPWPRCSACSGLCSDLALCSSAEGRYSSLSLSPIVRGLGVARKLEATTPLALALIFLLGNLVGQGHILTPVCCTILVALLLARKPQFRAFAGELTQSEVRSAILLALLGFVVWPVG
jgi:hypothetical protein